MTTLIGTRWKHSNVLSRGVLIRQQRFLSGLLGIAYKRIILGNEL